jgi:hypothetical protein
MKPEHYGMGTFGGTPPASVATAPMAQTERVSHAQRIMELLERVGKLEQALGEAYSRIGHLEAVLGE